MEDFGMVMSIIKTRKNVRNPKIVKAIMNYLNAMEMVAIAMIQEEEEQKKKRKPRSVWVWPYLQRRLEYGHYDNLMQELAQESPLLYKNFTRIDRQLFDEIVERVTPHIQKKQTWWRKPIPPGLRVAVTLRFLATGETYKSLQYSFRVAHNTISKIVPETCRAIIEVYGNEELRTPQSPEEWKQVAREYEERWNLPHCIGAIDGKHIRLRNPALGGTYYYNYKKFFSIVLLAIVDSAYKFLYVDVGAIGSESDGGIFAQTRLGELLNKQDAQLPPPEVLSNDPTGPPTEYYLVGDDAFPLRSYLMKPYPSRGLTRPERIYNYRLSRGRRTVENAFGILANRFRVFHTSICLTPDRAEAVVMASCILHNILRGRNPPRQEADQEDPDTHQLIPGGWRQDPPVGGQLPCGARNTATRLAKEQRNYLKDYFNSPEGSVPWQDGSI